MYKDAELASENHSTTQDSLRGLKDLISGTREDLEDQLDQVQQTISSADASLREILQGDLAQLQNSLDSIARAQRIADTARPEIIIEHNKAGQGSRAIFGTDTPQPQFNLTVLGNEAGLGAVASAGVHSPQTLQALLGNPQTPDLALALQALQTQSPNTNHESLQSILNGLSAERQRGITGIPSETISPTVPRTLKDADQQGLLDSISSVHEGIGSESSEKRCLAFGQRPSASSPAPTSSSLAGGHWVDEEGS